MKKEDIIRMASEAGMTVYEGAQDRVLFDGSLLDALERLANLAAAAERESIARYVGSLDRYRGDYFAAKIRERNA